MKEKEKRNYTKKFKKSKGAVTTIVLVTCLFFVTILSTAYAVVTSIRQSQIKSELAVKEMYENQIANANVIAKELAATGSVGIDNEAIQALYPVGTIYSGTTDTNPSTFIGGSWELISQNVIDTGWQDFSWTNSDYNNTTQSSYTQNKWRVKDNVLYIHVGAGAITEIDTTDETEIARIPIAGNTSLNTTDKLVWNAAIGMNGTYGGFSVRQDTNYIRIHIKPHNSSIATVRNWFSSSFAIPLDDGFTFTSGNYLKEYKWRRVS